MVLTPLLYGAMARVVPLTSLRGGNTTSAIGFLRKLLIDNWGVASAQDFEMDGITGFTPVEATVALPEHRPTRYTPIRALVSTANQVLTIAANSQITRIAIKPSSGAANFTLNVGGAGAIALTPLLPVVYEVAGMSSEEWIPASFVITAAPAITGFIEVEYTTRSY